VVGKPPRLWLATAQTPSCWHCCTTHCDRWPLQTCGTRAPSRRRWRAWTPSAAAQAPRPSPRNGAASLRPVLAHSLLLLVGRCTWWLPVCAPVGAARAHNNTNPAVCAPPISHTQVAQRQRPAPNRPGGAAKPDCRVPQNPEALCVGDVGRRGAAEGDALGHPQHIRCALLRRVACWEGLASGRPPLLVLLAP
jgi:hypothetical protein